MADVDNNVASEGRTVAEVKKNWCDIKAEVKRVHVRQVVVGGSSLLSGVMTEAEHRCTTNCQKHRIKVNVFSCLKCSKN